MITIYQPTPLLQHGTFRCNIPPVPPLSHPYIKIKTVFRLHSTKPTEETHIEIRAAAAAAAGILCSEEGHLAINHPGMVNAANQKEHNWYPAVFGGDCAYVPTYLLYALEYM